MTLWRKRHIVTSRSPQSEMKIADRSPQCFSQLRKLPGPENNQANNKNHQKLREPDTKHTVTSHSSQTIPSTHRGKSLDEKIARYFYVSCNRERLATNIVDVEQTRRLF